MKKLLLRAGILKLQAKDAGKRREPMEFNRAAALAGDHVYTLKKDGAVCVTSTVPGCGYSTEELKQLQEAGYEYYQDGKKVKIGRK
jgi:hypothetical protein